MVERVHNLLATSQPKAMSPGKPEGPWMDYGINPKRTGDLPLVTSHLPAVSMDLPLLHTSWRWSHLLVAFCVWPLSFSMFAGSSVA